MSPLLFVLAMDYLTRLLKTVAETKEFQYHTGCRKEKIINLSFADDLLIFSKATPAAVQCVLDALKEFFETSELIANRSKSTIYLGGIPEHLKNILVLQIAYTRGSFPMHYLGVPLAAKKW